MGRGYGGKRAISLLGAPLGAALHGCEGRILGIGKAIAPVGGKKGKERLVTPGEEEEEEAANLCAEALAWGKGPKWLGTVLSCLAAVMLSTASCRSHRLCRGVWDRKGSCPACMAEGTLAP